MRSGSEQEYGRFFLSVVFLFFIFISLPQVAAFICQLLKVEKYEKEYVCKGILSLLTEGRDEIAS